MSETYKQLMPAPGWKVLVAKIDGYVSATDGVVTEVNVTEVPVVGFAVVCHDHPAPSYEQVELLVWDAEGLSVESVHELHKQHGEYLVFSPSDHITERDRDYLIHAAKRRTKDHRQTGRAA